MTDSVISVVLATKDRLASLRRCLESLRACRLPAGWTAEILVVDNACSDETRALVESFGSDAALPIRIRYLSERKRGKAYAVNRGVAAARGKVLAFTDDDIVVDPGWLHELLEAFDRDPGLGLIAGRVVPLDSGGRSVAVTRAVEQTGLNDSLSLEGLILGCNLAIRPEVLQKVKGRDTRLGPGRGLSYEDIDFTHRVLRSGFRGVCLPGPTVYHEPGERDRVREYLRGRGAFYVKFLLSGDRKVSRQLWWYLNGIRRQLVSGHWRSAFNESLQLGWGACIMLARMTFSRRPYG